MVVYILNKTGALDYYHIFKVLYFAQQKHLAKWGVTLTEDCFCALKDGPVPSMLYDCVKTNSSGCDPQLSKMLHDALWQGSDDAHHILSAKRKADEDYLSPSEKEALDQSITENAMLSYGALRQKSHGAAWKEAFYGKDRQRIIPVLSIANDAHVGGDMAAYIAENVELENALS